MTPVKFKFLTPLGIPIANQEFYVTLNKAAFHTVEHGLVNPEVSVGITDDQGEATLSLFPANKPYYVTMDVSADVDGDKCCSGIRFRIAVPDSPDLQWADRLIVTDPIFSQAWDAAAIEIIMQAKTAAAASAEAAKASEEAAHADAEQVAADKEIVLGAVTTVTTARDEAVEAARQAGLSETASAATAEASRQSALSAAGSATTATQQAGLASGYRDQSEQFAAQAEQSKISAGVSETNSMHNAQLTAADVISTAADVVTTNQNVTKTNADVVTTTGLKSDTTTLRDEAKVARDEAVAAAGTTTGAFVDGGLIDLSGGSYPAKPAVSTIWKVTVGGTVSGTVYRVGDNLVYTKAGDAFYKNDNNSAVASVNGRTGAITLDKTDVGLDRVNNTNDLEKPISTATQAALDIRVPTASRTDMTSGRLVKVGDYGSNGGPALVQASDHDANTITVSGIYQYASGGVNLPETYAYIVHMEGVSGYAKQLGYGIVGEACYVRSRNGATWSAWGPTVGIVDNLTSSETNKALSARQGKLLLELLQANNATITRYTYNLSVGQSVVTGPDLNGLSLAYVPNVPMLVEKDGFPLLNSDYTATSGSSLTLVTPAAVASQMQITVFGSFQSANHYTKAEADNLFYTKTASDAKYPLKTDVNTKAEAAALYVPMAGAKGYIDGLKLVWLSATSVKVTAGAAYVPGANAILQLAADKTLSFASTVAQTHYHLYLYLNGGTVDVEISTTAPQNYYGTAYQKTGDTSRRYLGSVLSNTAATGVWQFLHYPERATMMYNVGAPSTNPFNILWQGFTSTTATLVSPLPVAPLETLTEVLMTVSSGAQFTAGSPADQTNTPPGAGNWAVATAGVGPFDVPVARSGANLGKFYVWISATGSSSGFVRGYRFER